MNINRDIEKFNEEGYVVLALYDVKYIENFKNEILLNLIENLNNNEVTFETFHNYISSDEEKIALQYKLNELVWENQLHIKIIEDNIKIYYELIGKDLDIQVKPYLRISRPNCPQDNIGFHRDSFYGNSAYEVSSFFPLVNLNENSALQIEPQSHKKGPIPFTHTIDKEVTKGSVKNQLGFLYAPKEIDKDYKMDLHPIAMNFGEVLIFGLGTIHGQEVNTSDYTRWSIDIRVKNKFAPTETKDGYYKELSLSPVSQSAKIYYEKNSDEL